VSPSQYVQNILSSTQRLKAVEVWFLFGTAEAVPFPISSTADSSAARKARSVGMTKPEKT